MMQNAKLKDFYFKFVSFEITISKSHEDHNILYFLVYCLLATSHDTTRVL